MNERGAVEALREGRARVELDGWWITLVTGDDATAWLNDLITARVDDLELGMARRSLLLTPTGRIRADFTVASIEEGLVLVQDPRQPDPAARILFPYVLSSKVELEDREWRIAAMPGGLPTDGVPGYAPSALGIGGHDLLLEPGARPDGPDPVSMEAVEAWRIEEGLARFPVDLTPESLPHEAGLDTDIPSKGCFLGQEAIAKVRNLGHPTHVIRAYRADGLASVGDDVVADGNAVGTVTSAAPIGEGAALIARIRWTARDASLATAEGTKLLPPRG